MPHVAVLVNTLTEVLIDRGNYQAALNGFITKDELALLVIQHMQSAMCSTSENYIKIEYMDIQESIRNTLFENSCNSL